MKHFVCFCVSTGSSPNTSLLSDQKGLWYTAPVLCHTAQCLLGNNLTSCARHIQAMCRGGGGREKKKRRWEGEREGREWWDKEAREKWEAERSGRERERGRNQFSSPVSIMSSPVSLDLRIKLLRDLPELQFNRCSGNVYPDVTDTCHTAAQNITNPSVSVSPGWPLP